MKSKFCVGKMFSVKNFKDISYSLDDWNDRQFFTTHRSLNKEILGNYVVVYDERGKQVKVATKTGCLVWINKYYLSLCVDQIVENPKGEMENLINELTKISSNTEDKESAKSINALLVKARGICDKM